MEKNQLSESEDNTLSQWHGVYLLLKQQQARIRVGSAQAKTRAEVSGGGAKPYRQKGTGNARRGSNRTPLRRGGGVIFGPRSRSYATKLNHKQVQVTYQFLYETYASKIKVVDAIPELASSKLGKGYLKEMGIEKKILFVVEGSLNLSGFNNFPNIWISPLAFVSVDHLGQADHVVMEKAVFQKIKGALV